MGKIDWRTEGRQLIWDYLLLTLGTLITAFAFALFLLPNDIAPGGVTGIATVLSEMDGAERRSAQLFDQPAAVRCRLAACRLAVCRAVVYCDAAAVAVY